ncbi:DUF6345 domain-containing protein [Mangrovibacterium lignilyticum]|uniref:DUF6345 domain-containing protein n=1 Tax=Mangrovibacterium lignilyticum TaxID=2668052 RepID=UPI0013D43C0A|nr:DUF6345 domain-containing protein [Mangrovibacterium lignilyticum]
MKAKNRNLASATKLLLVCLCVILPANFIMAGSREIGGYVDKAEDRFVRNVWNFVKNFQSWQTIGSHKYKEVQYYWAHPSEFDSQHQLYVDKMDLAYFACHGNYYYGQTEQSTSTGVNFKNCPPYGDLVNNGDLEFFIIESCYTVKTAPDVGAGGDWWTPWTSIFQGLHQLVGFHTLSNSDNGIPNNYAHKLKANGGVWQSWFHAVNEERYWIFNPTNSDGSPYPGLASAILYHSTENDRLGSYAADPAGGANDMVTWWQY